MDALELSVQNHFEFNQVCQKLKLMLKEQRDKIRENDNVAVEKDFIVKKINTFKVSICSFYLYLNLYFYKTNFRK